MKRLWIGAAISVLALFLLARSIDLADVALTLGQVDVGPIILAVLLVVGQVLVVSLRWAILLPETPAGTTVPVERTIAPVLIGYLGNFVLPARLGEPARAYLVARRNDLHLSATLGSVVLERLVDTATGALVAFALAVALGAPSWVIQLTAVAAVGAIVLFAFLSFVGLGPLIGLLRRWSDGDDGRLPPKVAETTARFADGMHIAGRRPVVAVAGLMSIGNWLVEGVIYWLCAVSLGLDLSLAAALLVATVTVLATAVPSAPGYLGTFELAAVAIVGAFGIAASPAFAFALLVHAVTVIPLAIGGVIALVPLGFSLGPIRDAALAAERVSITDGN